MRSISPLSDTTTGDIILDGNRPAFITTRELWPMSTGSIEVAGLEADEKPQKQDTVLALCTV